MTATIIAGAFIVGLVAIVIWSALDEGYHDADAGLDDRVDWETAEQWLREEA